MMLITPYIFHQRRLIPLALNMDGFPAVDFLRKVPCHDFSYEQNHETADTKQVDPAPERHRTLLLTGIWTMPENRYEFTAHLYLSTGGVLDGAIQWSSSTVWGRSYTSSGSEFVRGDIKDDCLELHGYKADPMLAPDHYKITLVGGIDSGSFNGVSRTCLGDWSGRTHGTYIFLYRE